MATLRWFTLRGAVALCALAPLVASGAHAAGLSLYAQVPFDLASGLLDLDELENFNKAPVLQHSLLVPYANLEALVGDELKTHVDRSESGTVVCSDPCPDVDYSFSVTSGFEFVQAEQPHLASFGDAAQNGVRVTLEGVQAKITLEVTAQAETWFDSTDPVHATLEVWLGAHGAASMTLWPVVSVPEVTAFVTLDGSNMGIVGLHGEAVEFGMKVGTLVGFSPAGVFVGGPLGGLVLGALGGDAAADEAERRIQRAVQQQLSAAVERVNATLSEQLKRYIAPAVQQANRLRQQVLTTPLPGVGRSLASLQSAWGTSFDVRSRVRNDQLRTVVTTRFTADANGGVLHGRVRLPKTECVFATYDHPLLGAGQVPTGVRPFNEDLAEHVGQACAEVLSPEDVTTQLYLGEDPEELLESGDHANALPRWAPRGVAQPLGLLEDEGDAYACEFQVIGLPAAGITELAAARLSAIHEPVRSLHLPAAGRSALFDRHLSPLGLDGVALGGAGPSVAADCPSWHSGGGLSEEVQDPRPDEESCPQCGTTLGPEPFTDRVLEERSDWVLDEGTLRIRLSDVDAVALNPQPLPPRSAGSRAILGASPVPAAQSVPGQALTGVRAVRAQ